MLSEPLPDTVSTVTVQFCPEPPTLFTLAAVWSSAASMLKLFVATPVTLSMKVTANTTWAALVSWPAGLLRVIDVAVNAVRLTL